MATEIRDSAVVTQYEHGFCKGCKHVKQNPAGMEHHNPCVRCFKGSNYEPEQPIALDRIRGWDHFKEQVSRHIVQYTIPQYGNDAGNDQASNFTVEDCVQQMLTYINRRNVRVRGNKEAMRDWIKVAHYAQFIYDILQKETGEPDVYQQPNT